MTTTTFKNNNRRAVWKLPAEAAFPQNATITTDRNTKRGVSIHEKCMAQSKENFYWEVEIETVKIYMPKKKKK